MMRETRAKRVASVSTIDTRVRKRVTRAKPNSSQVEVDAELDERIGAETDDHVGTTSNAAPDSNDPHSAYEEDDSEGLEEKLGTSHKHFFLRYY